MDFDNPKVYGDTFISDGLVWEVKGMAASADKSFLCENLEDVRNQDHESLAAEDKNRF